MIETVNADLKTHRGLGPLLVRGMEKIKCVALWSALAYNLLHFGGAFDLITVLSGRLNPATAFKMAAFN